MSDWVKMAGGYSTESARRALPNGANYSQLVEEGRGEVAEDNIHPFLTISSCGNMDQKVDLSDTGLRWGS